MILDKIWIDHFFVISDNFSVEMTISVFSQTLRPVKLWRCKYLPRPKPEHRERKVDNITKEFLTPARG